MKVHRRGDYFVTEECVELSEVKCEIVVELIVSIKLVNDSLTRSCTEYGSLTSRTENQVSYETRFFTGIRSDKVNHTQRKAFTICERCARRVSGTNAVLRKRISILC